MKKTKFVLGLHTKQEREKAYAMAKRVYDSAVKREYFQYGMGYIEAVMDLVRDEAPDDRELLGLLMDMYSDLNDRHWIAVGPIA